MSSKVMQDKIEHTANIVSKAGAAVAITPCAASFFSMEWWNENSAGIVAICAAIGATVSVLGFAIGQYRRHKASHTK